MPAYPPQQQGYYSQAYPIQPPQPPPVPISGPSVHRLAITDPSTGSVIPVITSDQVEEAVKKYHLNSKVCQQFWHHADGIQLLLLHALNADMLCIVSAYLVCEHGQLYDAPFRLQSLAAQRYLLVHTLKMCHALSCPQLHLTAPMQHLGLVDLNLQGL